MSGNVRPLRSRRAFQKGTVAGPLFLDFPCNVCLQTLVNHPRVVLLVLNDLSQSELMEVLSTCPLSKLLGVEIGGGVFWGRRGRMIAKEQLWRNRAWRVIQNRTDLCK